MELEELVAVAGRGSLVSGRDLFIVDPLVIDRRSQVGESLIVSSFARAASGSNRKGRVPGHPAFGGSNKLSRIEIIPVSWWGKGRADVGDGSHGCA